MRLLHARLHNGCSWISEDQPQSHQVPVGARRFWQPVSLSGLRQDPHRADARSGVHEEGEPCLELKNPIKAANLSTKYSARTIRRPIFTRKSLAKPNTARTFGPTGCFLRS